MNSNSISSINFWSIFPWKRNTWSVPGTWFLSVLRCGWGLREPGSPGSEEPCFCVADELLFSLSVLRWKRLAVPPASAGPQPYSPSEGSPCTASRRGAGWWRHRASDGYTLSAPSRPVQTWQKEIISVKLKSFWWNQTLRPSLRGSS